ncbi:PH domain-containing protein [Paenibacillus sepulcri]|uniref:PH domain-containing protein n=3 Tax=Paenibacillus sepulcri TaxID=359917 RepID=A0ABS7C407_9BACL|nr:PH domain-containing protein [Paenibacillus sepulcri]
MLRIDPKVIQARRLEGWITISIYVVIIAVLSGLTIRFDWTLWIVIAAAAWTVVSIPFEIVLLPRMRYRSWRYLISEHEIELWHGFFFRKRTLIPMVRIQHIDAKQGPILKHYGLTTLTFSTAAGSHEIPALTESTAEQVHRQIATLARLIDEEI